MSTATPTVGLVVPCHDEAGYVEDLLGGLLPQLDDQPHWSLVLVDDASTDGTARLLDAAASSAARTSVLHGHFGSPGAARSAGVAALLAAAEPPDWLLTVDADVEVEPGWRSAWEVTLRAVDGDMAVGAVNGVELQGHLYADFPNAARVSAAFGRGVEAGESAIGIANLNGVNHAIRTSAYLTCGPYVQPTAPGPAGAVFLAGSDWDLGVRVRRAGWTIAATEASVRDRGRRLLADVHAYVSGEAYEGPFRRLAPAARPADVSDVDVAELVERATERSLRHFLLKPLLAGVALRDDADPTLGPSTLAAIGEWVARWPHPTFDESRNGFVFGRLARFSERFTAAVRADLGLA